MGDDDVTFIENVDTTYKISTANEENVRAFYNFTKKVMQYYFMVNE